MKKSQPENDPSPLNSNTDWSIGANRLTAKGEAELLRHFGSKLKDCYQQIIEEPIPDEFKTLLALLERAKPQTDE